MFIANCIAAFCNDSLSVANEVTPTVADSVHSQTNAVADSVNSAVATTADSLNNVVVADSADAYVVSNSDNVAAPSKQKRSRKRAGEEWKANTCQDPGNDTFDSAMYNACISENNK